jgi:hypothetical protein
VTTTLLQMTLDNDRKLHCSDGMHPLRQKAPSGRRVETKADYLNGLTMLLTNTKVLQKIQKFLSGARLHNVQTKRQMWAGAIALEMFTILPINMTGYLLLT